MRKIIFGAMAVAVAGLTACSASSSAVSGQPGAHPAATPPASAAAEPGVDSYMCTFQDGAWLLQWSDAQGALSGTYQTATITGSAPQEQLANNSGTVSGSITGTGVTLELSDYPQWYGNVSGTQLSLNIPQSDGSIQPVTCTSASVSDWNREVSGLDSQVGTDNQDAAQAQASASASASQASALSQVQSDLSTVQGIGFGSDLGALGSDVQQTKTDLGTVESDVSAGQGQDCVGVSQAEADASTVAADASSVSADLVSLKLDLSGARSDVQALQSDLAALSSLGVPAPSGAQSVITGAQGTISQAVSAANGYIGQENSLVGQAYNDANSLVTGACSTSDQQDPPPAIGTIQ